MTPSSSQQVNDFDYAAENDAKLDSFLNRTDAAVFIHPLLEHGFGKFINVNETALKWYGYTRDEFSSMTAMDITNPVDSIRHARKDFRKKLKQKSHLWVRSEHLAKNGRVFPVEIDSTVIPHHGQLLILAIVRDLSVYHSSEKALVESEVRFRTFLENIADPTFMSDIDGHILDVNRAACSVLGYSRDEFMNMSVGDVDAPALHFDFHRQWDEVNKLGSLKIERMHRRKDGSAFPAEIHVTALTLHGQRVLLGTARDITERKEHERQLQESANRFRTVLEGVKTLAVQGYDADGTVFFWNKANEAIYGISEAEAIGQKLVDLIIPEEMRADVEKTIQIAANGGAMPEAGELLLQRKDGSRVWVFSSHVAVRLSDRYEFYCLDVDLSVTKEAEQQKEIILHELLEAKEHAEQANKAKDDFLAVLSHEMRTPLNPIVGFASLLLEDCREDQREFVETILSSSNRMLNLIEDILDFARFERGNQKLKPSSNGVLELCNLALADVAELALHLELSLENGFDDYASVPDQTMIMCDRNGLLRILDNLLTNACKYTEKGCVKLKVGVSGDLREGTTNRFVFHVSDTGIGIPEASLSRLFNPFEQVDSTYNRSYRGVGLGLAVCKKLVDMMDGSIWVQSEEGVGSVFKVEIPLHACVSNPSIFDGKKETKLLSIPMNTRILLVEDEEDNMLITKSIIEKFGGNCTPALDGVEAIEACHKIAFDLILMDLSMQVKDGFQTTAEIRQMQNSNSNTKIVALTADTGTDVVDRCLRAGMDAYLAKPVYATKLIEMIHLMLKSA